MQSARSCLFASLGRNPLAPARKALLTQLSCGEEPKRMIRASGVFAQMAWMMVMQSSAGTKTSMNVMSGRFVKYASTACFPSGASRIVAVSESSLASEISRDLTAPSWEAISSRHLATCTASPLRRSIECLADFSGGSGISLSKGEYIGGYGGSFLIGLELTLRVK